jgi:hypothetical protein
VVFDATRRGPASVAGVFFLASLSLGCAPLPNLSPTPSATATIVAVRSVRASPVLQGRPAVELEVQSQRAFPVRNEITVLRIGTQEFLLSRYPESGDTHVLIFTLTPEEFAAVADGALVAVQYGRGDQTDRWELGKLSKASLQR